LIPNVIELLGRSTQGVTKPFICRCDDGHIYYVKGIDANRSSQVKELISALLASELNLPIAPYTKVYVASELAKLTAFSGIGAGYAFGSRKLQVSELSISGLKNIPEKTKMDVLAFDWWIKNWDRTLTVLGGNPNLFWQPEDKHLVVIDHNQAFDRNFSNMDFMNYHVFRGLLKNLFEDIVTTAEYAERFESALSIWNTICTEIPEEWYFSDPEMTIQADVSLTEIKAVLDQVYQSDFWSLV
tara:strand:+ start:87 stop:812 length:726 start_codon:yes stop_codon:yes gene_type:complete